MSDEGDRGAPRRARPSLIDVTVPNAARAADYLYGGQGQLRRRPGGGPRGHRLRAGRRADPGRGARLPAPRASATWSRRRASRQFLDIGTGLVPPGATHEVAQAIDPACRDPVHRERPDGALARPGADLASATAGSVSCVDGDIADVDAILAECPGRPSTWTSRSRCCCCPPWRTCRPDRRRQGRVVADGRGAVRQLRRHLPPGERPGPGDARRVRGTGTRPSRRRSRCAPAPTSLSLVSGLELIPPGVVPVTEWRPDLARRHRASPPGAPRPMPARPAALVGPAPCRRSRSTASWPASADEPPS